MQTSSVVNGQRVDIQTQIGGQEIAASFDQDVVNDGHDEARICSEVVADGLEFGMVLNANVIKDSGVVRPAGRVAGQLEGQQAPVSEGEVVDVIELARQPDGHSVDDGNRGQA